MLESSLVINSAKYCLYNILYCHMLLMCITVMMMIDLLLSITPVSYRERSIACIWRLCSSIVSYLSTAPLQRRPPYGSVRHLRGSSSVVKYTKSHLGM